MLGHHSVSWSGTSPRSRRCWAAHAAAGPPAGETRGSAGLRLAGGREQVRPEIDSFAPAWADVVAAIEVPTLVIVGGGSSPVPQEQIADLVRHLRDGQMVTIEAGHLVHASRPSEFTSRLLSFLS